jgi:hypothetical protein
MLRKLPQLLKEKSGSPVPFLQSPLCAEWTRKCIREREREKERERERSRKRRRTIPDKLRPLSI